MSGQTHPVDVNPTATLLQAPSQIQTDRATLLPGSNPGDDRTNSHGSRVIRRHGHGLRPRQYRISENFYGDSVDVTHPHMTQQRGMAELLGTSLPGTEEVKKIHSSQSRHLPHWVWFVLAKSLGVKMHPTDRPWFGTIIYAVTLVFAMSYVAMFTWFTVYDIMSRYTKQTVLTGLMAIVIVVYWCSLGVYANKLAAKLFASQKFTDSVRLHTRTIFKVSAAGILVLIGTTAMILNSYSAATLYMEPRCVNITGSVVCQVMLAARVGYSVSSLIWNLLVGIVLLSVCRTHTIGIRRFIKQLEQDGKMYEVYRRNRFSQSLPSESIRPPDILDSGDDLDEYVWDEDISPLSDEYQAFPTNFQQSPSVRGSPPHTPSSHRHWSGRLPGMDGGNGAHPPVLPPSSFDGSRMERQPEGVDNWPGQLQEVVITHPDTLLPQTNDAVAELTPTGEMPQQQRGAFCPENRPIIIIKEGSVTNSEEAEKTSLRESSSQAEWNASTEQLITLDVAEQEMVHMAADMVVPPVAPPVGITGGNSVRLINPDPPSHASRSTQHSTRVEPSSPRRVPSSTVATDAGSSIDSLSVGPQTLSPNDILLCYWRINCRLSSTSLVLQRWLMAWVTFIVVWSCTFLFYWVDHPATLLGIAEFVLPILLLPLVCSAYGEVNMEGRRMLKCICPTDDRVTMMMFLQMQPLELTAFGFPINYSTIVKVIGALGLAFGTKIVLEEIQII